MSDIDAIRTTRIDRHHRPVRPASRGAFALAALLLTALVCLSFPGAAFAGHASTGKLAFYPCTRCHPVFVGPDGAPNKPLPIGLKKHEITLEAHDILGAGGKACLACHDDPTRNPGKLILADGSFVDVTGDVSRVCQRCHFEKYSQWKVGIHGKRQAKCTSAGCHDPHTPSWIYVPALPPFLGTGFEVHAVNARLAFQPLAGPPLAPPVYTPVWLMVIFGLGAAIIISLLAYLTLGRRAS